jgi:hypothetical protein
LVREAHAAGEPITVSFSMPGEEGALTATGLVRWSAVRSQDWTGVGLSWLPFDETSHYRLQRFLAGRSGPPASALGQPDRPLGEEQWVRKVVVPASVVLVLLVLFWGAWALAVHRRHRELRVAIETRNAAIRQFETRDARMHQELEVSRAHLAATAEEIARLDRQARLLEGEAQRLGDDVQRFHHSYLQVRTEREQLIHRVLDLEQSRAQQYVPMDQLQLAIREAIAVRLAGESRAWRTIDQSLLGGNRGYLIRAGNESSGSPRVSIRVHDPEALP